MRFPTSNVPIFPLSAVLFPDGVLSLKIFETRYLDMVSRCLKQDVPFGVCMIVDGHEVGKAASCYQIGTLAKIINWGQTADGVLEIEAMGCQRFKMLDNQTSKQELITANIQLLADIPSIPVPDELVTLTGMLRNVLSKNKHADAIDDKQFHDANWVGYRLTEVLPMESVIRQRLLEIDDPIERLHMILGLFTNRQ
ncbi:MAG TPA: peptidase S16, lon-like protein [Cycloclasticus sp.]|jgi:Lon protease-like protein|nr:peptidase S16, lon-like protein [Cycloclasticus sp.]HIL91632.1 peptidase S16, lon-like protein [Cycloclasticus sp.]